ncbi:ABC transporter ATP-binding protein [Candidatus Lucifugimonas marina]|uniref:ABC transporter ATP-binding protein n=1 Tax=Candidatus Lucifugimonas marina TaxID=3038979 RepID=UPI00319791C7|nr:ATP-binding cassette domain-containing protein [SAR202 cluster bacterium JH639]
MVRGHGVRHARLGRPLDDAPKRPMSRETLVRVAKLYKPYRKALIAVAVLILVSASLLVATPLLIRQIIDDAIPNSDRTLLYWLTGWMIGVAAVSGVISYSTNYLNMRTGLTVMEDLRLAVYAHLQKLPLSFFTSTRTGDLQTRISSDVASTQMLLTDTLGVLVSNSVIVISSIVAMLVLSWELSIVALVTLPIFAFAMFKVGKKRRELTRETQKSLSDLTSRTGETLSVSGVMLSKTFGREADQLSSFKKNSSELTILSLRQTMTGQRFSIVMQTFFTMAPAIIWLLGGSFIIGERDSVSLGDIVAFTAIQARLLFPMAGLFTRGVQISSSIALFDRIFEYLDIDPKIKDPEKPVEVVPAKFRGDIEYQNVGFGYSELELPRSAKKRAKCERKTDSLFKLSDISFSVQSGGLTALVGPSGAGKTSVGYLLARLYDADSGAISIDGINVKDMAQADLSKLIGVVSQDSFMFHASIKDNLLFGKSDATEEEMVEATKAAQIFDLIDGLPERFDTVVGERGYRLSGGERQRLAIARVILANPRILLLDEATSSLDTLSERLIQQALTRLREGRTTIAIAHRLSTVIAAEQILVMDGGKIADRGTNEELLERSSLYRQLYEEQFTVIPSLS